MSGKKTRGADGKEHMDAWIAQSISGFETNAERPVEPGEPEPHEFGVAGPTEHLDAEGVIGADAKARDVGKPPQETAGEPPALKHDDEGRPPDSISLVGNKTARVCTEILGSVVRHKGAMDGLDDPVLKPVAIGCRDAIAATLRADTAEIDISELTLIERALETAQRGWKYQCAERVSPGCGDLATWKRLGEFAALLADEDIWSKAFDDAIAAGSIEGRLIEIARSIRQALVGNRQLRAESQLTCKAWPAPVQLPVKIGKGPPPRRKVVPSWAVGYVTGSDWADHFLRLKEVGRRGATQIDYNQARFEAVVEEARRHHNNVYRAEFLETYEDGVLKFRSLVALEVVTEDMFTTDEK